jgi:rRNA maturation endonuclease Nob1
MSKQTIAQVEARNLYRLSCLGCKKTYTTRSDKPPKLQCGDCLMDRVEVVTLKCELIQEAR